jgi:transposase
MFIRKLKSRNGNIQIQVVEKIERNNQVIKHLGTARNSLELQQLSERAQQFIDNERIKKGKISFFDTRYSQSEMESIVSRLVVVGAYDSITFHFFNYFYKQLSFNILSDDCFRDLVIARIANPVSKVRTREWLDDKFGITHRYSLAAIYRGMERAYRLHYQEKLEKLVWDFTSENLSSISVLFFDVTTLYYEAFDEDDLRKFGYSKDHKENQPQLVIALTVTAQGMPLQVRVFAGNKFEGHTMIPCMQDIIKKHTLADFVVVADSAMVSAKNMDELEASGLKYIVGARLGNLSQKVFDRIVENTPKVDGSLHRFNLENGRVLVVGYSTRRADKDRTDRNKQLKRAEYALQNPSTIVKRYKFLKKTERNIWELNQANLEKMTKLEGLKGYMTNAASLTDEDIATKYGDLWNVEKTFRMSKSDLKARPIFHTVQEKIEAHITIVYAGLAIARYAEIVTGKSIRRINELLEKVKEVLLKETLSEEVFSKYTQADNPEVQALLKLAKINWVT